MLLLCVRQVSTHDGQMLASQWDCPFFETSAALRLFVDDTFHGIIREIRKKEKELALTMEKKTKKQQSGLHSLFRHFRRAKKTSS